MAGPAYSAAAEPVKTKIPAPMTAPIPSVTRLMGPRARFSECSPVSLPSSAHRAIWLRRAGCPCNSSFRIQRSHNKTRHFTTGAKILLRRRAASRGEHCMKQRSSIYGPVLYGVPMKRTLSLAAMTLAVFLVAPKMYGQTNRHLRLRFHVPFSVSVNNETFTPGEYEVTQESVLLLKVANLKSNDSAYEAVNPAQSREEGNGQVRLVFHRYGSRYFLVAVSDGSWESTYDFKTSADEKQMAPTSTRIPMMTVSIDQEGSVPVAASSQKLN